MSETSPEPKAPAPDASAATDPTTTPDKRKETPNPFDLPFAFSGLLLCMALWFGRDGWFNPETESIMFNRIVFGFLLAGALFTAYADIRSIRKPLSPFVPPNETS